MGYGLLAETSVLNPYSSQHVAGMSIWTLFVRAHQGGRKGAKRTADRFCDRFELELDVGLQQRRLEGLSGSLPYPLAISALISLAFP